mgnify:FL=1
MQISRENSHFIKAMNLNNVNFTQSLKSPLNTTLKMRKCSKNLQNLFKNSSIFVKIYTFLNLKNFLQNKAKR